MSRTRSSTVAILAVAALAAGAFAPAVASRSALDAPDGVPDRGAVLAEPIRRGSLLLEDVAPTTPSAKVIDGLAGDWASEATDVGGTSRYDAGELVHTDFLFDAYGADNGADRDRLEQFADLFYAESRLERLDQLLRTSGSQLGVPEPLGAPDEYGDVGGGLDVADITEVRLASDGEDLQVLVSVANLVDPSRLGVLLLADDREGSLGNLVSVGGMTTDRYDMAVLAHNGEVTSQPVVPVVTPIGGEPHWPFVTATGAVGYDNHLELSVDLSLIATDNGTVDVAVVAGRMEDDGSFTPLNAAFRPNEPVEIYNDRQQAFALLDGTVDAFSSGPVAVADLTNGRTQDWTFGGGYFERHFVSDAAISSERSRDGVNQPYAVYVPSSWERGDVTPATYWLHYRGGKAHSATVINPRLTTQLGEERGNLVFFPHARGTSEWYVTESAQDFFEVMADAESLFAVDPERRYVSGYSMGGYGSWLLASLYPDLFAAAFVQSGAVTQGLWAGQGADGDPIDPTFDQGWQEANGGDVRAQLTYHAIENLRHVPFAIDHGTDDELVPITGLERMAQKLTQAGYAHRMTRFVGYEHFTQAIMDEWADGAAYLDQHTIDPNPRQITYALVPALVHAMNTVDPAQGATFAFDPDGAYWIDDISVRNQGDRGDGRPGLGIKGTVNATSHAIAAPGMVTVPDAGVYSPVNHSTPFVRTGLQLLEDPTGVTAPAVANRLDLSLTNVSEVSVDVARTGLDASSNMLLSLTSDGDATVRLVGAAAMGGAFERMAGLMNIVRDGDDLVITLTQGSLSIDQPVGMGPR